MIDAIAETPKLGLAPSKPSPVSGNKGPRGTTTVAGTKSNTKRIRDSGYHEPVTYPKRFKKEQSQPGSPVGGDGHGSNHSLLTEDSRIIDESANAGKYRFVI